MEQHSKIFVAGHGGMVGSALVRKLHQEGYRNLLLRPSAALNLTDQAQTEAFFRETRPEYVFLAAAKVGGIVANNTYRAEFIYENLMIQANVIHNAWKYGVQKLLFLGSSCIYPKECPQPIREEYLLTGPLEITNEPYALAKIAGLKMCESYWRQYGARFISCMPTNLYGPNDNYDLEKSHVLPALLRKFHEAKQQGLPSVEVWGTGRPRREFLHVDDLADAALFLMRHYEKEEWVNVGTGEDIAIYDLAHLVARIVGYEGNIRFNTSKPDGTLVKRLDVSRLAAAGWKASIPLETGIRQTYELVLQRGYEKDPLIKQWV